MAILDRIHGHQDLVNLDRNDRIALCSEIRDFLVSRVSQTGGHLASNLGVVELTVALETVFDTNNDRLVFDVGHQSYVHKILTGRQSQFDQLRQFGGMAGFPKPGESDTDAFVAGHASSSVSIALGMARARTALGDDYSVVALIGDGAMTGGMAYEGLNDAGFSAEPLIVILNDNEMSIDRNVGGMATHLRNTRAKPSYLGMKDHYRKLLEKLPGGSGIYKITRAIKERVRKTLIPPNIFENMGFTYLGPVDGHDTELLIRLLNNAKAMNEPVLIHAVTHKGHGYRPAEENPRKFHGVGKFDPLTGQTPSGGSISFSQAFGQEMEQLAAQNKNVCAITAAMPAGTGLLGFSQKFPERIYDVGIAEEHAVSMAGGLAKQGMVPVVALYSTFLQRSYDMILQDICMLNLHVVFAIDRAGLVGEDGETHHGVFDIGFLRHAPNMMVLCPGSCMELSQMLRWAVCDYNAPVAIRYPRGGDCTYHDCAWQDELAQCGMICRHTHGDDITIITYGTTVQCALDAAELLKENGIHATVLRLLSIKPLPIQQIIENLSQNRRVLVVEETAAGCSVRDTLAAQIQKYIPQCKFYGLDLGDQYVTHGSVKQLYQHYKLDGRSIADYILEVCSHEG